MLPKHESCHGGLQNTKRNFICFLCNFSADKLKVYKYHMWLHRVKIIFISCTLPPCLVNSDFMTKCILNDSRNNLQMTFHKLRSTCPIDLVYFRRSFTAYNFTPLTHSNSFQTSQPDRYYSCYYCKTHSNQQDVLEKHIEETHKTLAFKYEVVKETVAKLECLYCSKVQYSN